MIKVGEGGGVDREDEYSKFWLRGGGLLERGLNRELSYANLKVFGFAYTRLIEKIIRKIFG